MLSGIYTVSNVKGCVFIVRLGLMYAKQPTVLIFRTYDRMPIDFKNKSLYAEKQEKLS